MFILYFLYGLIIGIFCYFIFKTDITTLIFYIVLFEMLFFITQFKYRIEYNPFFRFFYILSLLIGYFSSIILYNNIDNYDPNLPNVFH